VLLHDGEELDDDLGGRPDEHLPLATLLGVEHVLEGIVENTDANHGWLLLPVAAATTNERGRQERQAARERERASSCSGFTRCKRHLTRPSSILGFLASDSARGSSG
jgi:hypothetical protein